MEREESRNRHDRARPEDDIFAPTSKDWGEGVSQLYSSSNPDFWGGGNDGDDRDAKETEAASPFLPLIPLVQY